MAKVNSRIYHSPSRERQASETRRAIADAAERLICTVGYAKTTISAIAREAGVSCQTVYAVFGSKRGILMEIFDRVILLERYRIMHEQAMTATNPRESLRHVASIMSQIFHSCQTMHAVVRGSTAVSPELAQVVREQEERRRELQREFIDRLYRQGHIRADLDLESALDVFWCLSGRDSYRLLVEGRNWSAERYEAWIVETMSRALLAPSLEETNA